MTIKTITKENFQKEVIEADRPVLVEFWAPWCGSCKRLNPVLDRLADKLGDRLPIAKINIDEEPELPQEYEVDLIPTLYLFQEGRPGEKLIAPPSQAQLETWLHGQTRI